MIENWKPRRYVRSAKHARPAGRPSVKAVLVAAVLTLSGLGAAGSTAEAGVSRTSGAVSASGAGSAAATGASGAKASSSTAQAEEPPTVSADALPTWQVDGVVWNMVTVGRTVYATGNFSKARPPGTAPGGPGEVSRKNLLAFDLVTGDLVQSFDHELNGQGLRVAASPDGSRVYVGGDFTTVNGKPHARLAAFDTASGNLVNGFAPQVSARVRAIAATNDTVYIGGNFFRIDNHWRTRLGAVRASDGSVLPWAPTADDDEVHALLLAPDASKVIVGGMFQTLNDNARVGIGAVHPVTGADMEWKSTPIPAKQDSRRSWVTDLTTDGQTVYGSANGQGGHWFDGRFAARLGDGELVWLDNCYGASYGVFVQDKALYSVSHAHDCASLGAFPEMSPRVWKRALATTTGATGPDYWRPGNGSTYAWQPVPSLLHWFPHLLAGSVTGQYQGAWTVTGDSRFVALGGEFPRVNGDAQQGLVRFRTRDEAPNKSGPVPSGDLTPTATSLAPRTVRVGWKATWDYDDPELTYEILRDGQQVGTVKRTSEFWTLPALAYFDTDVQPGDRHTYRVRVVDPDDNRVGSGTSNEVTVSSGTAPKSDYADAVNRDGARHLWRLGENGGSTARDYAGSGDLRKGSGISGGQPGAIAGDDDGAASFNGFSSGRAASPRSPISHEFSLEAWFKTSSSTGGKIIGYGTADAWNSGSYDRHIYLTNDGRVVFGVYPDRTATVRSPAAYRDNKWHHVVGTLDREGGLKLYVDGELVARDENTVSASVYERSNYPAYWRVGGDNLGGWPYRPLSYNYDGLLDEVAVYPKALTAAQVSRHHAIGTGTAEPNKKPEPSFTSSCAEFTCDFDASASSDPDGEITDYEWDFGDGSTGTGVKPTHKYSTVGTYDVKLTVTDDEGATESLTKKVTITSSKVAEDRFQRTVSNGLGTADIGGPWSVAGNSANLSVNGGAGHITMPRPGTGPGANLNEVSSTDTDVTVKLTPEARSTGGGVFVSLLGRRVGAGDDYRTVLRLMPDGKVRMRIDRNVGGTPTQVVPEREITGVTYQAGSALTLRFAANGTGTTALKAKVWTDGTEPGWQLTGEDSAGALQVAGGIGLKTYLSSLADDHSFTVAVDDLVATP